MTHISMFPVGLVHCPVDRSIVQQHEESYLCMCMQERTMDRESEGRREGGREGEGMEAITSVWAFEVDPEAPNINLHDPSHKHVVYDKSAPLWLCDVKWNGWKAQEVRAGLVNPCCQISLPA